MDPHICKCTDKDGKHIVIYNSSSSCNLSEKGGGDGGRRLTLFVTCYSKKRKIQEA